MPFYPNASVFKGSTGGGGGAASFGTLTGSPYDNADLSTILNSKADDSLVLATRTLLVTALPGLDLNNAYTLNNGIYHLRPADNNTALNLPANFVKTNSGILIIESSFNEILNTRVLTQITLYEVKPNGSANVYTRTYIYSPIVRGSWMTIALDIVLATELQDGLMNNTDFSKLLYITAVVDVGGDNPDVNFTADAFVNIPKYLNLMVYADNTVRTITLPDLENDPTKSSFDYTGDTWSIQNNSTSAVSINIIAPNGRQILDGANGLVNTYSIDPNVKAVFKWEDKNPDPNNRITPVRWVVQ